MLIFCNVFLFVFVDQPLYLVYGCNILPFLIKIAARKYNGE